MLLGLSLETIPLFTQSANCLQYVLLTLQRKWTVLVLLLIPTVKY